MIVETARPQNVSPDRLTGTIRSLLTQAHQSIDNDLHRTRVLVSEIVNLINQSALVEGVAVEGGLTGWQIARVNRFINANLATPLTLAELAPQAKLSASYFIRAFKISYGTTPRAYIRRRRLQHAQEMMRTGSESLADIAAACGLSDQSHLVRLFRRFTGMSPSEWRHYHGPASGLPRNWHLPTSSVSPAG